MKKLTINSISIRKSAIQTIERWRAQTWSDWRKVRSNPKHRFKNDLYPNQLRLLFWRPNPKLPPSALLVEALICKKPHLAPYLYHLQTSGKKGQQILKEILLDDSSIEKTNGWLLFNKKKELNTKPKKGMGGLHYTDASRQQDGNLFLANHANFKPGEKTALFLGASFGLTALKFLETLPVSIQPDWKVISSDYCSPDVILKSMHGISTAKKRLKIVRYMKAQGIHYQIIDLFNSKLKPNSFDFLDVCNCLDLIQSLNHRLNAATKIWNSLTVGGYLRTTTPNFESKVRQVIFKKTGPSVQHWSLEYASLTGKTYTVDCGKWRKPERAFELGKKITVEIQKILNTGFQQKSILKQPIHQVPRNRVSNAFVCDLADISPIGFMAGVPNILKHGHNWKSNNFEKYVMDFLEMVRKVKRELKIK